MGVVAFLVSYLDSKSIQSWVGKLAGNLSSFGISRESFRKIRERINYAADLVLTSEFICEFFFIEDSCRISFAVQNPERLLDLSLVIILGFLNPKDLLPLIRIYYIQQIFHSDLSTLLILQFYCPIPRPRYFTQTCYLCTFRIKGSKRWQVFCCY